MHDAAPPAAASPSVTFGRRAAPRSDDAREHRDASGRSTAASYRTGFRAVLLGTLGALLTALLAAAAFTWYELSLRTHDYAILNLTGQLRVTAESLTQQSRLFLRDAAASDDVPGWYANELRRHVHLYDRIIDSLAARNLPADLTGLDDAIRCNWDAVSRAQLDRSVAQWRAFRPAIERGLRADASRFELEAAAAAFSHDGPRIADSTLELSLNFRTMMERHLAFVSRSQIIVAALGFVLAAALMLLVQRRVLDPLAAARAGVQRIARGELGLQLSVVRDDELGDMARAVNALSLRMRRLFDLTHRIGDGLTLGATLDFVREEFGRLLPVAWVGLLVRAPGEGSAWRVSRASGDASIAVAEGSSFAVASLAGAPLPRGAVSVLRLRGAAAASLETALACHGCASALLVPLRHDIDGETLLVFAAHEENAYTPEFTDLLTNIGSQLRGLLDRTTLTEALVIAAVEGLAKLAESRDPETGNHLLRMSLYSELITEEMGRHGREVGRIGPRDAEAIRRFAPMHDIGKVGLQDRILLKAGPLTAEERAEMQLHPSIGAEVLRRCEAQMNAHGRSIFRIGIEIAESHHERWDGTGYPHRLAGEQIPLSARVVAVADVFDALTSRRPYKSAWPVEQALAAIRAESGRHFDPEAVAALERALPRVFEVYERLKHV
ncbi:MAG TPA: HD domain-containing phosphohydrolase [Burkholderiaceae bacterium]|nr:HD domain-containing phosphohydrolase [Burkholderiaceae bacterium]